jgi:hypothetical protein
MALANITNNILTDSTIDVTSLESTANKAINLTSPDDVKYPTTLAVSTALSDKEPLHTFLTVSSSRALLDSDHLKTLKIENTLTLTIPDTGLRDNFEVFTDVFPTYTLTWSLDSGVTVSGNEGLTQEQNTQSLVYKLGSSNAYRLIGQV